ncbi:MAG: LPS export ABC transporter permease LptF [Alphaproteobacteria bacterium]
MKKIFWYIFRQLLVATILVATTLTCMVWLTQSLRFVEMIVNRGLSIPLFLNFTLLLLPTFFAYILPIAVFASVIFTYNRLIIDSELIVMRASGYSQFMIARPAIILATLVTLICFSITTYFLPASYREFKDLQISLRNSLPTILLQDGVFNTVMKGVTVYVRKNNDEGELSGIVIHDSRSPKSPVTMMAERGVIISSQRGPRVVMVNGNRQQVDPKDGHLSLLYFDRYSFDIGTTTKDPITRWREPRERFLTTLMNPSPKDSRDIRWYNKLIIEGHHRLSMPFFALAFTFVGLALLLGGSFNRRGQLWRVVSAVGIIIILETSHLGVKNLGEKATNLAFLMYLIPILPIIVSACFLGNLVPITKRKSKRQTDQTMPATGST